MTCSQIKEDRLVIAASAYQIIKHVIDELNQNRKSPWSPDMERTEKRIGIELIEARRRAIKCPCDKCKEWSKELEALIKAKS